MNNEFDEVLTDKMLGIDTGGIDKSASDEHHSPYEPTSYAVLDRLIESKYIEKEDVVVDFGCGKGRVPIYLTKKIGCRSYGVDMEEKFIDEAMENAVSAGVGVPDNQSKTASGTGWASFRCVMAERMIITEEMNVFYFFNPFSYDIFQKVLRNILDSYYNNRRDMFLFFYYPSDEYVSGLMTTDELMFLDDIDCMDLFPGKDNRERILIFQIL